MTAALTSVSARKQKGAMESKTGNKVGAVSDRYICVLRIKVEYILVKTLLLIRNKYE